VSETIYDLWVIMLHFQPVTVYMLQMKNWIRSVPEINPVTKYFEYTEIFNQSRNHIRSMKKALKYEGKSP